MNHRVALLTPDLPSMTATLGSLIHHGVPFVRYYWQDAWGRHTKASPSRPTWRMFDQSMMTLHSKRLCHIIVRDRDLDLARLIAGPYLTMGWEI